MSSPNTQTKCVRSRATPRRITRWLPSRSAAATMLLLAAFGISCASALGPAPSGRRITAADRHHRSILADMQSTHRRLQDSPPNTVEVSGAGDANGTYYFTTDDDGTWELSTNMPNEKACPFFCYETEFDIHRCDMSKCWFIMDEDDNTCYRNDDYSQNALTPPESGWTGFEDDDGFVAGIEKRFCEPLVTSYFVEATSYGATRRRLGAESSTYSEPGSEDGEPTADSRSIDQLYEIKVKNSNNHKGANGTYTLNEDHTASENDNGYKIKYYYETCQQCQSWTKSNFAGYLEGLTLQECSNCDGYGHTGEENGWHLEDAEGNTLYRQYDPVVRMNGDEHHKWKKDDNGDKRWVDGDGNSIDRDGDGCPIPPPSGWEHCVETCGNEICEKQAERHGSTQSRMRLKVSCLI